VDEVETNSAVGYIQRELDRFYVILRKAVLKGTVTGDQAKRLMVTWLEGAIARQQCRDLKSFSKLSWFEKEDLEFAALLEEDDLV